MKSAGALEWPPPAPRLTKNPSAIYKTSATSSPSLGSAPGSAELQGKAGGNGGAVPWFMLPLKVREINIDAIKKFHDKVAVSQEATTFNVDSTSLMGKMGFRRAMTTTRYLDEDPPEGDEFRRQR